MWSLFACEVKVSVGSCVCVLGGGGGAAGRVQKITQFLKPFVAVVGMYTQKYISHSQVRGSPGAFFAWKNVKFEISGMEKCCIMGPVNIHMFYAYFTLILDLDYIDLFYPSLGFEFYCSMPILLSKSHWK